MIATPIVIVFRYLGKLVISPYTVIYKIEKVYIYIEIGAKMEEEFEEEGEIIKRFGCPECGHSFAMDCETPDMLPKFCPFCASPVYIRDVDEDDEYDEQDETGFHL